MIVALKQLAANLEGELFADEGMRIIYATDASPYREMPLAVVIPQSINDLKLLIQFANTHKTSLIPRAAGTSLAGQVVGSGIVVDISKHFNRILELNAEEKWVRVQPGVVRDELNAFLLTHGLCFGPETSTANRAMIGGMVSNNSCGSNSIRFGSTRDHVLELKTLLSDGSEAIFKEISLDDFQAKCEWPTLEGRIYKKTRSVLSKYENQLSIRKEFPKKEVQRRNTGYAIDSLLETAPFVAGADDFNFCKLIAGAEGTLAFITEIKLNLEPLPPKEKGVLCVHFSSIDEALRANLIAVKYNPIACELIDHYILECTKENIEQRANRFFVKGDPAAILIIEIAQEKMEDVERIVQQMIEEMQMSGMGYHFPLLKGKEIGKLWSLRKAGLGLLSNLPGDEKAVSVIEDTAVAVSDLPKYIKEFNRILAKYSLHAVHYAHVGSGELHLRPILNLKTKEGQELFRTIAQEIAILVKKYNGSLSGEHGDGRLRSEFIPLMIGESNYKILQEIKTAWDPNNIFNPNKIVNAPPMNTMLRSDITKTPAATTSIFRFPGQNLLQHVEQCNGSGDCRKSHLAGGTMCPSYMATRNEKDTTRARANILREFLTRPEKLNRYGYQEVYEVMDLCLSCKACKSECPSNVDMTKLKAEFLQQYYDVKGVPFRARLIANFSAISRIGSRMPSFYNFLVSNKTSGSIIKYFSGFAPKRSLPVLHKQTLKQWFKTYQKSREQTNERKVYLFCDEFTDYNDTQIGIKAILLLNALGYEVLMPAHEESGRSWLSKGLVRKAKKIANKNISSLAPLINSTTPLLGIEPSALLTFRDEYIDLADEENYDAAKALASNTWLIEEFIAKEWEKGNINRDLFTKEARKILLHGHCQQKVLSSISFSEKILAIPENYQVQTIASGCCGMAGSFGYEKEHYETSIKIGELTLLPTVRSQPIDVIIAASGTSCRHQIKDATSKLAEHPIEILFQALL